MRQLRLPIFTSKIRYYNLRIVPASPILEEVTEIKKQFEFAYGKLPLVRSVPHITLASFKMNSKYQRLLISTFEELKNMERFTINIEGYDVFEGSNTLYLNISNNDSLRGVRSAIRMLHTEHLKKRSRSFVISEHPHMTVSKTSGRKMLNKSLVYFKENDYHRKIEVNHLTLVSRIKHKKWDWEHKIPLI